MLSFLCRGYGYMQIDSLDIQISAQVNKANASITTLSNKLNRLTASLSGVNPRGLATLGAGVNKLANAMSNFSANTKTADFSRLARNLTTISNIDTSKFSELSAKISQLSTAFGSVGTIDASGIANIGTSLSKLGGKNAIAGADNLIKVGDKLSQFVTQMNGIGSLTFDATNLSNLINSISRLGGKNATEAAKNLSPISAQLQNFVRQLNSIGSLTFDTANLSNLIAGITRLGGKAATSAAANIPKLATELSSLMTTLSKAPAINKNVIDMTNALANLARTGASSGRAANSLSQSFANISSTGNKTLGTLKGIQGSFRSLLRSILPFVGVFQLFSFGKQAIEISSDLTEVQNVVDTTFGDMAYKVESLAKTSIQQFGLSELSLKQFSSRFQAMGTAMGFPIEKMSDMSIELTKLTADMSSFYNVAQEDVAKNLQSIFTGETEPLRKYGLDLTQATLQEWAHKQGIDAKMSSMSQAEKTMLRYQYVMANTGAAQGDFADTAKTWANQTRILTQQLEQLASIVGGVLINAFKPLVQALNEAMSHIIAFAETISNALGKIFGWKFEKGGGAGGIGGLVEDTEDLESGLGGAEKAAKKLNKQLRAFDELNLITTDTDGAGGAGGGAGGAGADVEGQGGKWVQTESILQGYESELDTLYKLGDYIGTKLSEAMESIRWEDVYEKARNFGTGLASFLNGLISPRLFGNVGTTIAGSLNTALHFLDSFGEEFDWNNFGESIAAGANNFFSTFDFGLLANTINVWANGLLDAVIEFLDDTEWEMIGEQIGTFLEGLDFIEIGGKLAAVLEKAVDSAIETWKGAFDAAPIETAIITAIAVLKFTGLGTEWFSTLSSKMSATVKGKSIGLKPTIVIAAVTWEIGFNVGKSLGQFLSEKGMISEADYENFTWFGEDGFFDTIIPDTTSIDTFISDLQTNLIAFQQMATDFENNPAIASLTDALIGPWISAALDLPNHVADMNNEIEDFGKDIESWWDTDIAGTFSLWGQDINAFWDESVVPWFTKEKWTAFGENIKTGISEKWKGFTDWWRGTGFYGWWNEDIAPWFTFEKWSELGQAILDGISAKWNELSAWWGDTAIVSWWEEDIAPWFTVEKWNELLENVKTSFASKWSETSEQWKTDITDWWEEDVAPWFTVEKWTSVMSGIIDGFKKTFKNAANAAIAIFNNLIDWINSKMYFKWDAFEIAGQEIIPGGSIRLFSIPPIPKLATGGLVYKSTFAEIGEAGTEAILPLTNRAAMHQLVNEIMESAGSNIQYSNSYNNEYSEEASLLMTQNQLLRRQNELLEKILKKPTIGNDEIGKRAVNYIQGEERRLQKSLVGIY